VGRFNPLLRRKESGHFPHIGGFKASDAGFGQRSGSHPSSKSIAPRDRDWIRSSISSNELKETNMAVAKKQATVTQKTISTGLAEKLSMTKKDTIEFIETFVSTIAKHVKKGDKVRLPSLGTFMVRHRKARMGRNPATGEAIKIKASKKLAFRAAKELKEAI
jgi:DNA-binding protein HU-beta